MTQSIRKLTGASALALCAAMAGCASTQTNSELTALENRLQSAQSDSDIVSAAPDVLSKAEKELAEAQSALDDGDKDRLEHQLYLSEKYILAAEAEGRESSLRSEFDELRMQRAEMQLSARERELRQTERALQQTERRVSELSNQLRDYETRETEDGTVVVLQDLLFAYDAAQLKSGSVRNLQPLASFLNENDDREIVIEGHTDATGPNAYNEQLSKKRADAVKSALVSLDVEADRIETRGLGEAYPVASNDTDAGRQQNRRVEVTIE